MTQNCQSWSIGAWRLCKALYLFSYEHTVHIAYIIIYNHCYHRFTKDCSIHQSVVIIQSNSQCKQENSNINLWLYFSFVIWCIIAPSLPGCLHPTKETRPANGPENLGTCASSQPAKYDKRHNHGPEGESSSNLLYTQNIRWSAKVIYKQQISGTIMWVVKVGCVGRGGKG